MHQLIIFATFHASRPLTCLDPAGLNKPFDRILKSFAEESPRMFLHLLGIAPLDAAVKIEPIPSETAPVVKMTDYVAAVQVNHRRRFLFHVEFLSWYRHAITTQIARYGGSLAWQHGMPVKSVLLLLRQRGVPARIPTEGVFQVGQTRLIHPFRTVKTWELDPRPIFESNDPRLFPWVVLMKSTDRQVREVAAEVVRSGDDESIARFLTLGTVRYDRDQLGDMLGGANMGFVEAVLEGSFLVRDLKRKARKEGLAEGRAAGRAEGRENGQVLATRKSLQIVLKNRYPGLESMAEIQSIDGAETLEALLENAVKARSRISIRRAIIAASKS